MGVNDQFFVVFTGRKPGIYHNWDEACKQMNQFSGSQYGLFTSLKLALDAWLDFRVETAAALRARAREQTLALSQGASSSQNVSQQNQCEGIMFNCHY